MDEQQKQVARPYPPAVFWRALLAFRNHAFVELKDDYFAPVHGLPKEGTFRHSVDVVDCYIDIAIADGWMDDRD